MMFKGKIFGFMIILLLLSTGASALCQFSDGDIVTIKSWKNKYLTAIDSGCVYEDKPGCVFANMDDVVDTAKWTVKKEGAEYAFKSPFGKYLVADFDGEANANRITVGTWEKWTLAEVGEKCTFLGGKNQYLVAENDGVHSVNANRDNADAWEKWVVEKITTSAEVCNNDVDDDYDSAVDCGDLDCSEECKQDNVVTFKQKGLITENANWYDANTATEVCQEVGLSCNGLSVIGQSPNAILNSAFKDELIKCDTPFSQYEVKIDSLGKSDSLKDAIKKKDYEVQCEFVCNGEVCTDNKQMCDPTYGCSSCLSDTDCSAGLICDEGSCKGAGSACVKHDDCLQNAACDTVNNVCVICSDGDNGKDTTQKTTTTGIWLGTATSTVGKIATSTDFCLDGKVSEFYCQESTKGGDSHMFVHSNNIFCEESYACQAGACVYVEPLDVPEQCDNNLDDDKDTFITCDDIDCATSDLCKKSDRVMIKEFGSYDNTENWLFGDVTKNAEYVCQDILSMGCAGVHYEIESGTTSLYQEYNNLLIDCQTPFLEFSSKIQLGLDYEEGYLNVQSAELKNAYFAICGELCNNKIDDDGDGLIDCADSDCVGKQGMLATGKTVTCCLSNDDVDDDGIADQCSDYRPLCNEDKLYCESPGDVNEDFVIDGGDLMYLKGHLKTVWGLFGVWDNSQLTNEERLVKLNQAVVHIIKETE